jgi:hypothetical protein
MGRVQCKDSREMSKGRKEEGRGQDLGEGEKKRERERERERVRRNRKGGGIRAKILTIMAGSNELGGDAAQSHTIISTHSLTGWKKLYSVFLF